MISYLYQFQLVPQNLLAQNLSYLLRSQLFRLCSLFHYFFSLLFSIYSIIFSANFLTISVFTSSIERSVLSFLLEYSTGEFSASLFDIFRVSLGYFVSLFCFSLFVFGREYSILALKFLRSCADIYFN